MLCRAVLTAVAISCTLCREVIAQPNTLDAQRIVQIKDLICVLWLSGLQKEDLDVNMLQKLQRHNVNIDDMNNETLRQECQVTTKGTNSRIYSYETKQPESTTSSYNLNNDNSTNIFQLDNKNFAIMSKYFMNMGKMDKKYVIENKKMELKEIKPIVRNPKLLIKTNTNENNNNILNATFGNIVDKIVSNTNNHNIESIMAFWNRIANNNFHSISYKENESTDHTTERLDSPVTREITSPNTKQPKLDLINKLIAEYISKERITIQTTTTAPRIDLIKISKQIEYLMEKAYKNRDPTFKEELVDENAEANPKIFAHEDAMSKSQPFLTRRSDTNIKKIEQSNYGSQMSNEKQNNGEPNLIRVIEDIKTLKKQLNLISSITSIKNIFPQGDIKANNKNNYLIKEIEAWTQKQSNNFSPTQIKQTNLQVNSNITENQDVLPKDVIQDIAEKVKRIVLNDLIKYTTVVGATDSVTTKATTEITTQTTVTLDRNKTQDTSQVIEKIMEFFKQYRTIKEGTIITDTKYKMTKDVKHEFNVPLTGINYSYLPFKPAKHIIDEVSNTLPSEANLGIQNKLAIYQPYSNFMPQDQLNLKIPIIRHTPVERGRISPITIQTNSNEIPPLVVPISKPLKLINQNIIVTTKEPFKIIKNERQYWDSSLTYGRNKHSDRNFTYNIEKSVRYSSIDLSKEDRNLTPQQKFKATYRNIPIYGNERPRYEYSNYNIDREGHKYKTDNARNYKDYNNYNRMHNPVSVDYRQEHQRNDNGHINRFQNGERFHEKLERDDWNSDFNYNNQKVEDSENCCQMKVASRQQLPLNSMKKHTSYNDIHFKKILKTQQKVNDMLERILATKTKSDGPQSVETT